MDYELGRAQTSIRKVGEIMIHLRTSKDIKIQGQLPGSEVKILKCRHRLKTPCTEEND
jgi:hypothetical protein